MALQNPISPRLSVLKKAFDFRLPISKKNIKPKHEQPYKYPLTGSASHQRLAPPKKGKLLSNYNFTRWENILHENESENS